MTPSLHGPRCCHWHMGYDFEYFRMLCAERPKREKNRRTGKIEVVWALREGFQRNEALDLRVGNMAVREILNPNYAKLAKHLAQQAAQNHQPETPAAVRSPQPTTHTMQSPGASSRNRPSWFNRR